jgi:hypothetical protein
MERRHHPERRRHNYETCDARVHIADLTRQIVALDIDAKNRQYQHDLDEKESRVEIKTELSESIKSVIMAVEGIRKQIIGLLITIVAAVVVAGVLSFFKP